MKQPNKKTYQSGFTLVELAIVMIIIGLLIGGVLKGQQLIENAKITATISELKGFQVATLSFRDTYGTMPGDSPTALTRLSGCGGGANFCASGNGDSLVGTIQTNGNNAADVSGVNENTQYWKHLALADLVTGIDPSSDPAGALAWGEHYPKSSMRGGYQMYYNVLGGVNVAFNGHFIRLQNNVTGSAAVNSTGAGPISPLQAAQIDRKMDDGLPDSGVIMADDGTTGASGCEDPAGTGGGYDETNKRKDCILLFKVDN